MAVEGPKKAAIGFRALAAIPLLLKHLPKDAKCFYCFEEKVAAFTLKADRTKVCACLLNTFGPEKSS